MRKVLILSLISVIFLVGIANAAPSKTIPMQGRLLNSTGSLLSGIHAMQFSIYNQATGGSSLWSETLIDIEVTNGLFSIVLGEDSLNPLSIPFDEDYYIEITVNGETLSPRQRLLSAPYAITSQNVVGGNINALQIKGNEFCISGNCITSWPSTTLPLNAIFNSLNVTNSLIAGLINTNQLFFN